MTEFTGRELRCLIYLLRMTYGFQRKEYELSLSDWSTGTNISRSHIPETLRRLADRNIIYRTENGNRKPATFGFNKYFEQWNEPTATGKVTLVPTWIPSKVVLTWYHYCTPRGTSNVV